MSSRRSDWSTPSGRRIAWRRTSLYTSEDDMTHVDPSQLVVGAPVVTSDATVTVDASVTNPVDPGDHVFQLIVVDENGVESTPVEQRVTISPDDRKPQAVLTAMPAEVAFGEPFTLDGTESAPVPGHQITSYKWIMMTLDADARGAAAVRDDGITAPRRGHP